MELNKILSDFQEETEAVLVDDNGQLTFVGCMLLVSIHLAFLHSIKEILKNEKQQNKK